MIVTCSACGTRSRRPNWPPNGTFHCHKCSAKVEYGYNHGAGAPVHDDAVPAAEVLTTGVHAPPPPPAPAEITTGVFMVPPPPPLHSPSTVETNVFAEDTAPPPAERKAKNPSSLPTPPPSVIESGVFEIGNDQVDNALNEIPLFANWDDTDEAPVENVEETMSIKREGQLLHFLVGTREVVELSRDEPIKVGRSEVCSIWIQDHRASRIHAELAWSGKRFSITDCQSKVGTEVNNRKVQKPTDLSDYDEIKISDKVFIYRIVPNRKDLKDTVQLMRRRSAREGTKLMTNPFLPSHSPEEFKGSLDTMTVPEICQVLMLGQREGELLITKDEPDSQAQGSVFLRKGHIVAGHFGDLVGEAAVLSLMRTPRGTFRFKPGKVDCQANVTTPTSNLLMKAMQ